MAKSYEEILAELKKMYTELETKLEEMHKMRVERAKLELEILRLYTPQCLEILHMLEEISVSEESTGDEVSETTHTEMNDEN